VIYLIGEIVLYLLAALLLGVGAGWLLRSVRSRQDVTVGFEPGRFPDLATAAIRPDDGRTAAMESESLEQRARSVELEAWVDERDARIATLTRRLGAAERQVQELERERALQNRALQVLHQQLELALDRRPEQAPRAAGGA
jgi:hypothetical protein